MSNSQLKILVTGANGQVGWELMRRAERFGVTAIGMTSTELDITDAQAVAAQVQKGAFDVVVNAAAYTAVDKAESEPEKAYAVNRDGPDNLARACAEADIPLIHISTDYVFDGSKKGAYTEDDPVCPVSVYGASKEAGERAVRERLARHIILRTAWVYGVHGHNFVKTMLRLAKERDELRVVADQWGCPTAAGDIAEVILSIVARYSNNQAVEWGTYHYCGDRPTTWHGFAEAILAAAEPYGGRKVPVRPIATTDYPTPAKRPANSVLDSAKIRATLGIAPRVWGDALQEAVQEIAHQTLPQ